MECLVREMKTAVAAKEFDVLVRSDTHQQGYYPLKNFVVLQICAALRHGAVLMGGGLQWRSSTVTAPTT